MFPYIPDQDGYNKRMRKAGPLLATVMRHLATRTPSWWDNLRLIDSTPLPCAASRETVKRCDLAGDAGYGYCASHSRFFWGFRLYLVCAALPRRLVILASGERLPPLLLVRVDVLLRLRPYGLQQPPYPSWRCGLETLRVLKRRLSDVVSQALRADANANLPATVLPNARLPEEQLCVPPRQHATTTMSGFLGTGR